MLNTLHLLSSKCKEQFREGYLALYLHERSFCSSTQSTNSLMKYKIISWNQTGLAEISGLPFSSYISWERFLKVSKASSSPSLKWDTYLIGLLKGVDG